MDITRKKLVIIPLESLTVTASGKPYPEDVSDFRIRLDVLDRLRKLRALSRIVITYGVDGRDFHAMLKAVEFFVFVYNKVAATCRKDCVGLMEDLPHSLRKKDFILSVGDHVAEEALGIDYMNLYDFLGNDGDTY